MRSACISSRLLGSRQNLIITEDNFFWSDEISHEAIQLNIIKSNDDLNALAKVSNLSVLSTLPSEQYVRSFRSIVSQDVLEFPPWKLILNDRQYVEYIEKIVTQVRSLLKLGAFKYFEGAWCAGNSVLKLLECASIDHKAFEEILQANEGNIVSVESFKPLSDGLAPLPIYDRFGSVTGRMTIEDGPMILTLKKEHRAKLLKTSTNDNVLLNIDFSAMEARVVLYEHGGHCDDIDLYGKIASELKLPRDVVKGSVIAELYGMSKHALAAKLGLEKRVVFNYMKDLDAQFRVSDLKARLRSQYNELGAIKNRYGRLIKIDDPLDNVLLNYYAQSSAVDVAMYGFLSLLEQFPEMKLLFLIHDAIIVELPEKLFKTIGNVLKIRVPGYVSTFPLKIEKLNT